MYPRNAASPERIAVGQVVLIADGTIQSAAVVVTVRGQGGAEAGSAGTIAFGADNTVYYTPTQAETDFTSFTVIASKASCFSASVTIVTTASATPGTVESAGTIKTLDALDTAQDLEHAITQAAVGNISHGSGGIATVASAFVKSGAEPETNTFADTATIGTLHIVEDIIATGVTDIYYEFNVGNDGVPQDVEWRGYAQGNGDTYSVEFYNWAATAFDPVASIAAVNGTAEIDLVFKATIAHVGTGANAGLVRLRFLSTDGSTIATNRMLCVFTQLFSGIANGSTITLGAATNNQNLMGHNWILDLSGEDIGGSYFTGSKDVSGIGTCANGSQYKFEDSLMNSPTLSSEGQINGCGFHGATFTSTAGGVADEMTINRGNSHVEGSGVPLMDWSAITKTAGINIRGWLGGGTWTFTSFCTVSLEVFEGGGHTINADGADVEFRGSARSLAIVLTGGETIQVIANTGPITISGAGVGSTVNIYGSHSGVTNTATGSPTVLDAAIDNSITAESTSGGITLSAAQMNAIADHVIRRTSANARASSDGDTVTFRSLLGGVSKLTNKVHVVSTDLVTREEDDATSFGVQAITTDASAEPITALDTT